MRVVTALGPWPTVLALDWHCIGLFSASKLSIDTVRYLLWNTMLRSDVTLTNLPISSYS